MSENDKNSRKSKASKKKLNKKKKIIIISLTIVALLIASVVGVYLNIRNQIYVEYTPQETKGVEYKEVSGVTNVLLIGTDGRTLDESARSDSIIIATIDSNTKKVKLTSIMRDILVDVPGYGEQKINAAFALGSAESDSNGKLKGAVGGAGLLLETIRNTFKINIDKYAIVNFWGFESIIDEIGGIEADIKDYEIDEINKYIGETTETKSEPITKTGVQLLNGAQALSYSRIRYVGNSNFERGERQRAVLYQIATKFKDVNPLKYVSIANSLAKHIKTNIDIPEALNLAYTVYKFPSLNFEQIQMPQNELIVRDYLYKDLGWCLIIDKDQNSKVLHDFIFEDKLPNPEEFSISQIKSLEAQYNAEEARYNSLYNVKPEEYNDKDKDKTNVVPKPAEKPEAPKPEEKPPVTNPEAPKPETTPQVPQVPQPEAPKPEQVPPAQGGNGNQTQPAPPTNGEQAH
ncbi:hypothetical protein JCM1393_22000 [Clostridium carnis]